MPPGVWTVSPHAAAADCAEYVWGCCNAGGGPRGSGGCPPAAPIETPCASAEGAGASGHEAPLDTLIRDASSAACRFILKD